MKHNKKILQEIIDKIDSHDELRNNAIVIKIAELYAEWTVRNNISGLLPSDEFIKDIADEYDIDGKISNTIDFMIGAGWVRDLLKGNDCSIF